MRIIDDISANMGLLLDFSEKRLCMNYAAGEWGVNTDNHIFNIK